MKVSRYILSTLKEDPSDAVVLSHRLMMRAGLIKKEAAGMYSYLPMGLKVLKKVMSIVREEMDREGAMECLMPELTNADLWKESGRWNTMGPEMFRIKDRNGMEYSLGPTHEESMTNMVRSIISSYRDLPLNVYQINTKFRDEIRPRFGVIRSKEFIMKDAYSYDINQAGLDESYQSMARAYRNIFSRCGLETIPVQADSGTMGGNASEEFMVASEVGEEVLLLCEGCDYRANREKAAYKRTESSADETPLEMKKVSTPDVKTIEDLEAFFGCSQKRFLKSIVYIINEKPVMVVVPGDREVNEHKVAALFAATEIELANDEVVEKVTGAMVGFAGPVGTVGAEIVFDETVPMMKNAITGANEAHYHLKNVNPGRDFEVSKVADVTSAMEGDTCSVCGGKLYEKKGIEVGHIFKLGDKYTKGMNVSVLDENGKAVTPLMGCYGIGVNRTVAAIVEQNNDERGVIWPKEVTPFQVHFIGIGKKEEQVSEFEEIYSRLMSAGFDVLYDDRKSSPGIKFADADLVGIPVRVTAGKGYFESGRLELKYRNSQDIKELSIDEAMEEIGNFYKK